MTEVLEVLQAKYREIFLHNPLGQDVLADILRQCRFGSSLNSWEEAQEHNLAIYILARCGIFGQDTQQQVVRALANVVPTPTPKQEEEDE